MSPTGHQYPSHFQVPTPLDKHPWLTGTSKVSWVSSSIWILTVMSFPEGVGGGFCPRSKVLIPEFSGAPRRDAGVGFCSISPMVAATYLVSAGNDKRGVSGERGPLKLPRSLLQCLLLLWDSIPGKSPPWSSTQEPQGSLQHACLKCLIQAFNSFCILSVFFSRFTVSSEL